jgi:sulfur-oxidizing protein SoxY
MMLTFRLSISGMLVALCALLAAPTWAAGEQSEADVWETLLKDKYFKGIDVIEGNSVIELTTPYRAEDAALTPVSITAQFPQSEDRWIETIWLVVDKNPTPLAGVFHMTKEMGKADLAMRIRVNEYTNVRAIAKLNTGEYHMKTNFVKAQGGCSAPLGADLQIAKERAGQMKFRIAEPGEGLGDSTLRDQLTLGQFMVSHPQVTGMQKDQKTQLIPPPFYVESVKIFYNDTPIMTAEINFSISADPAFRFFFKPQGDGKLRAEVSDNTGSKWTHEFDVDA